MSNKLLTAIWDNEDPELTGSKLVIMLSLADQASDEGIAWPSIRTIARRSRLDERSVYRHIADLQETGYLHVHNRPGRSSMYLVRSTRSSVDVSFEAVNGVTVPVITRKGTPDTRVTPDKDVTPTPDTCVTPTPDTGVTQNHHIEPSIEPSKDSSAPVGAAPKPPRSGKTKRQEKAEPIQEGPDHRDMFGAVQEVCRLDPKLKAGQIAKTAKQLRDAGYTPDQVREFPTWWRKYDWRGQRGDVPTTGALLDRILQATSPIETQSNRVNFSTNGGRSGRSYAEILGLTSHGR